MTDVFNLIGSVAIVTGGNRGLGLAIARGYARAGARVVVAARDAAKADAALAELRDLGGDCAFVEAHIDDPASCAAMVAAAVDRFGRLDILVNNAGVNIRKPPEDYSLEEWRAVIDVNLTGPFLCAQAAYPVMKAGGGGKIINVGSLYSTFGGAMATPYAASKGGVVQLTKSLAVAWAKDNIQVNVILPGWHETDLTDGARQAIPGLSASVVARTPAGRWGQPDDVVGAALLLASPAANFITGASLAVDGGYSSQG
jgi:2-deoxy-D-gluconate 3-dehydrogenase